MVDFEETFSDIIILARILVENQLRQVVLASKDKSIHIATIMAAATDAIVFTQETGLLQQFLIIDNLHMQSK